MKKLNITLIIFLSFFAFNFKALAQEIKLDKCIDGDTTDFIIDGKVEKVRYLAIDTPETKHPTKGVQPYGKEASNYTCNALKNAKKIEIEYDSNSTKTDKYGRYLGWIFVDGELLQGKLVKSGLAKVAYLYGDYKYTDDLKELESEAKENKLKIWSDYKEDNSTLYLEIALVVIILIICIFNKSYRRKTVNKVKRKVNSEIDSEISKLLK